MTEIVLEDLGGATFQLLEFDGKLRPPHFRRECVDVVPNLPLTEDDVLFCSYPKSGSHWMWEIIRMLLLGSTTEGIGDVKENYMLENVTADDVRQKKKARVWDNHLLFSELPTDVMRLHPKIVFVYRNPKDIAVSFYHMVKDLYEYDGKFDDFLELFLSGKVEWGCYFDYMRDWDKVIKRHSSTIPIHILTYEDMRLNGMEELQRLSRFLGKEHSNDFLESVKEASSLKNMRNRKGQEWELPSGDNVFYRKGMVGGWKDYFSVSKSERVDKLIQEQLSDLQFKIIFK